MTWSTYVSLPSSGWWANFGRIRHCLFDYSTYEIYVACQSVKSRIANPRCLVMWKEKGIVVDRKMKIFLWGHANVDEFKIFISTNRIQNWVRHLELRCACFTVTWRSFTLVAYSWDLAQHSPTSLHGALKHQHVAISTSKSHCKTCEKLFPCRDSFPILKYLSSIMASHPSHMAHSPEVSSFLARTNRARPPSQLRYKPAHNPSTFPLHSHHQQLQPPITSRHQPHPIPTPSIRLSQINPNHKNNPPPPSNPKCNTQPLS